SSSRARTASATTKQKASNRPTRRRARACSPRSPSNSPKSRNERFGPACVPDRDRALYSQRETKAMKVGLYLATQFTPETDVSAARKEMIEQVRAARQSGFSSLWVPHHYATQPMQMLAPIPLLAYLLREAEGMTIGPNILILPLLNPIH